MIKFIGKIIARIIIATKQGIATEEAKRVIKYSNSTDVVDGALLFVKQNVLFELLGETSFSWVHMNPDLLKSLVHQDHGVIAKLGKLEIAVMEERPVVAITMQDK